MRLPTVKLRHRSGKVCRVNQTDYVRDIARWVAGGWNVVGTSHGDAPDEEVAWHARQSDIEKYRRTDPAEMKTRGDARRAFEARRIEVRTEQPDDVDWRTLPWFERRALVKKQTGVSPKTAEHAERLMTALNATD